MTNRKKVSSKFPQIHIINLLVMCIFCCYTGSAQNDTIVLKNKDRLTGHIKGIENGVLIFKTDYSDETFKIKWEDVQHLKSNKQFFIVVADGSRHTAAMATDTITKNRLILYNKKTETYTYAHVEDIVYAKSEDVGFTSALDASLSLGINLTEGNNFKQLTVRSTFGYRFKKWALRAYGNSINNRQDKGNLHRTDAGAGGAYTFKNDNFVGIFSDLLSSDVQQLDLRIVTRGGVGRYIVHTNRVYFSGMAGLAWNNEKFDITPGRQNSTEAFGGFELNLFDVKNFSLLTNAAVYPNLTVKGRVRTDVKFDLKYNLPLDFFMKLGLSYNYDRKPAEGARKEDYVFLTTFGWEL